MLTLYRSSKRMAASTCCFVITWIKLFNRKSLHFLFMLLAFKVRAVVLVTIDLAISEKWLSLFFN